jgi:hypothetical protein
VGGRTGDKSFLQTDFLLLSSFLRSAQDTVVVA